MSSEDRESKLRTINSVISKIRPFLQREGGDIELDSFDDETGVVKVNMIGACSGCFFASDEISMGVETILRHEIPSITKVEIVSPTGSQFGFDPTTGRTTLGGIPVYDPLSDDDLGEEEEDPLSPRAQLVRAQRILTKTDEVDKEEESKETKPGTRGSKV